MLVAVGLSAIIGIILLRTVRGDIHQYNSLAIEDIEDTLDETGWKLIHGDVFRKPKYSRVLSMCVGCGSQILCMTFITVVFAGLGFLSPAQRGAFLQWALMLFALMGSVAGYVSQRFYRLFDGQDWKTTTLATAFLFPGLCFSVFFLLNLFMWYRGSSGAVPFFSLLVLLFMWVGMSVPLTFIGASVGKRRTPISIPVTTNKIPRVEEKFGTKYFGFLARCEGNFCI